MNTKSNSTGTAANRPTACAKTRIQNCGPMLPTWEGSIVRSGMLPLGLMLAAAASRTIPKLARCTPLRPALYIVAPRNLLLRRGGLRVGRYRWCQCMHREGNNPTLGSRALEINSRPTCLPSLKTPSWSICCTTSCRASLGLCGDGNSLRRRANAHRRQFPSPWVCIEAKFCGVVTRSRADSQQQYSVSRTRRLKGPRRACHASCPSWCAKLCLCLSTQTQTWPTRQHHRRW